MSTSQRVRKRPSARSKNPPGKKNPSRHAFRKRDAERLIRSATDAGLKITALTLDKGVVTLTTAGAPTAQAADSSWDDLKHAPD